MLWFAYRACSLAVSIVFLHNKLLGGGNRSAIRSYPVPPGIGGRDESALVKPLLDFERRTRAAGG